MSVSRSISPVVDDLSGTNFRSPDGGEGVGQIGDELGWNAPDATPRRPDHIRRCSLPLKVERLARQRPASTWSSSACPGHRAVGRNREPA